MGIGRWRPRRNRPSLNRRPRGPTIQPGHYNRCIDDITDLSEAPDTRLAIYGTLAPGRVNHHQISALAGSWQRGTVKGKLFAAGWGAALGFPGLIMDPLGPTVDVDLFESTDLPAHWARLDEFEGSGYRRVVTTVNTVEGERSAWIYVLAEEQP
jgi:gamma-glutamylcyclotransferase (GGCT)/AIG2-like uncharacterized protein YtfP